MPKRVAIWREGEYARADPFCRFRPKTDDRNKIVSTLCVLNFQNVPAVAENPLSIKNRSDESLVESVTFD